MLTLIKNKIVVSILILDKTDFRRRKIIWGERGPLYNNEGFYSPRRHNNS